MIVVNPRSKNVNCNILIAVAVGEKSLEMSSSQQQQLLDQQQQQQQQPDQSNHRQPAEDEEEEEEVISCICNIFRDEGLMIQCERCLVRETVVIYSRPPLM